MLSIGKQNKKRGFTRHFGCLCVSRSRFAPIMVTPKAIAHTKCTTANRCESQSEISNLVC